MGMVYVASVIRAQYSLATLSYPGIPGMNRDGGRFQYSSKDKNHVHMLIRLAIFTGLSTSRNIAQFIRNSTAIRCSLRVLLLLRIPELN